MYSRTAHIRRTHASLRFNKRLAIMALVGTAACVAALLPIHDESAVSTVPVPFMPAAGTPVAASPRGVLFADAKRNGADRAQAVRHIFPYSIVPGGVTGKADLVRAIRSDPAVAAHYASFVVDKAQLVTVAKPRGVYVSYRKDGQIYWTAKKVMLAEGETLLSDGVNEIRTRCGNRISDVPQQPVAHAEPSQEVLDTSIDMPEGDGGEGMEHVSMAQNIGTTDHGAIALARGDAFPDAAGLNAIRRAAPAPDRAGATTMSGTPAFASTNRDALPYALVGTPSGNTATTATTTAPTPTTATTASARPRSGTTGGVSDTALNALRDGLATTGGAGSSTTGGTDSGNSGTAAIGSGTAGTGTGTGNGATGGNGGATGQGTTAPAAGAASGSDTKTAATMPTDGRPVAALQTPTPTPASTPTPTSAQQPATTPGKTPLQHADVPEPGSLWLSGLGFAAMLLLRRKRRTTGT